MTQQFKNVIRKTLQWHDNVKVMMPLTVALCVYLPQYHRRRDRLPRLVGAWPLNRWLPYETKEYLLITIQHLTNSHIRHSTLFMNFTDINNNCCVIVPNSSSSQTIHACVRLHMAESVHIFIYSRDIGEYCRKLMLPSQEDTANDEGTHSWNK